MTGAIAEAKPLKAYQVREGGEGHCAIVFATNGAAARRLGAIKLDTDFESIESCCRAPQFDDYSQAGTVPRRALLDAGWWFECSHCGQQVSNDGSDGSDDEGNEMEPVVSGLDVFCNTEHMMRHWAERRATQARHQAVIDAAYMHLGHLPVIVKRVADFTVAPWEADGHRAAGDGYVATALLRFPGMESHEATWVPSDPSHVRVSPCDLNAWEAMRAAHKPAAP